MPKPNRIVRSRTAGIDRKGKYQHGARAKHIVIERVANYPKRKTRAAGGTPRVRTPSQIIRRLERALAKRKTETARARIRAQIAELQSQLS